MATVIWIPPLNGMTWNEVRSHSARTCECFFCHTALAHASVFFATQCSQMRACFFRSRNHLAFENATRPNEKGYYAYLDYAVFAVQQSLSKSEQQCGLFFKPMNNRVTVRIITVSRSLLQALSLRRVLRDECDCRAPVAGMSTPSHHD